MTQGVPSLKLDADDLAALEGDSWLTDKHIRAAQKLLKDRFPKVDGLQDTCLVAANEGCVMTSEGVQILHVRNNHWICASTFGCPLGTVRLYDSLNQTRISPTLSKQLATLLQPSTDYLTIDIMETQQQEGVNDCGLFAIAHAYALCEGIWRQWEQDRMRPHLQSCFETNIILPFPGK